MKKQVILLLLITTLLSCGENPKGETVESKVTEEEKDPLAGYAPIQVELTTGQLNLMVPEKKQGGDDVEVFMGNSGVTNIVLGKNFHLEIIESLTNLENVKMDLERDLFYKTTVVEENADRLVYEKELPDHSKKFVHFFMNKTVNGHDISIRSAINGEFKRSHIDRMLKSANTFSAPENLVSSVN